MGRAWHLKGHVGIRARCDRLVAQRPDRLCTTPDCGRPSEKNGMCKHCLEESQGIKRNRLYRYDWSLIDSLRYEGLTWPQIAERTGYKAQQMQWAHYHRRKGNGRR